MNYKAYIFDYDYTLAFSEPAIIMCFKYVFEKFDIKGASDLDITRTIGMPLRLALASFASTDDAAVIERMYDTFHEKANEVMTAYSELYPEVIPLFDRILTNGARIGIVSNKPRFRITDLLRRCGIENKVSIIIGAEDFTAYKPDPEGLETAISFLGVEKNETLYIGDSIIDCLTAKNAGTDFAAVTTGATKPEEFLNEPHIMIAPNLSALSVLT